MDLFRALDVSASALAAERVRMDVISENLANSEATASAGRGLYRRKIALLQAADGTFPAILDRENIPRGGVRVAEVAQTRDPARRVHQPGHPQAGPDGFVELPNVDPLAEMLDMLAATRAYEANATAFQATKGMAMKLLELLR